MPTREDSLAKRTYKEDGLDVEKRVFYTLQPEGQRPQHDQLQINRNSKAISYVFKLLLEKKILTIEQLDDILLDVSC